MGKRRAFAHPTGVKLTLSFDNGPFPDVTPGVLEALDAARARATFFVCGKDARDPARRPLLEAIRAAGHRIGNHTQSHRVELGVSRDPDAPRREIEDAQAALAEFADADKLFRPYGAGGVLGPRLLSRAAVEHLCAGRYTCVLWNSVPRDWEDVAGWPDRALADLRVNDWTLLVLHDVPTGAMRALPDFLARARDAGAELAAELPPSCVPILRGRIAGELDRLIGR
ncbi:MAG TPA: polysaccharide deacetylase family protein [Myxococcota bacterium]|nr:polysaccharide deacetylase family protein [Myxococcota bacterium]